jgi:hypothetical protein
MVQGSPSIIDTILDYVLNNNELSFRVFGTSEISSLPKGCQLEIFKNYADEVRPEIFYRTDLGKIIDDHIDILSYALTKFLLSSAAPSNGSTDIAFSTDLFTLYFNQILKSGQTLDSLFVVNKRISIDGLGVTKLPDQIYFDSVGQEYYVIPEWRLDWSVTGVEKVNISYQLDSNTPVAWKTNHRNNWINFPFIPGRESFTKIKFVIQDADDPTVSYAAEFLESGASDGTPIKTQNILPITDLTRTIVGSGDVVMIKYTDTPILPNRPFDEYSLTMSENLLDNREVAFNDSLDLVTKFTTQDYLRTTYVSAEPTILSDPNNVTIRYNREITSVTYTYEGSEDGLIYTSLDSTIRYSGNTAIVSITKDDCSYVFYRLTINSAIDVKGNSTIDPAQTIEFLSNHNIVYEDGRIVIDGDNKIVTL